MTDQWQLLKDVELISSRDLKAEAYAPAGSSWFSGHFPGEPILPGIALLSVAEEAIIRDARARGEVVRIKALRRVRFTQPVRPGENLVVHLTRENAGDEIYFNFKVSVGENVVSSGLMSVEIIKKDK